MPTFPLPVPRGDHAEALRPETGFPRRRHPARAATGRRLSLFGSMTTPRLLRAADSGGATRPGKAKSVILFNLLGGPSHQDMFDLKPTAPAEIRGEFRPIATSLPGLQICEHLPSTARLDAQGLPDPHGHAQLQRPQPAADHDRLHRRRVRPDSGPSRPTRPTSAPICQYLGMGPRDLPGAVCLPCYPGWGESSGIRRPGPYGGFLGSQYDPLFTRLRADVRPRAEGRPTTTRCCPIGEPQLPSLDALPEMTVDRLDGRRSLLEQLDDALRAARASPARRPAGPVPAAGLRAADVEQDARRLRPVAGARRASATATAGTCPARACWWPGGWSRRACRSSASTPEIFGTHGHSYDMHENNFGMLKDYNLPILDQAYPGADRGPGRARPARLDAGRGDGRDGPHAAGQRQGRPRPLAAVRLQPAGRRRRHGRASSTARPTSTPPIPASDPGLARRPRGDDLSPAGHRPAHDACPTAAAGRCRSPTAASRSGA